MKSPVPFFVLAAAALAAGCGDTRPTAPKFDPSGTGPRAAISDGSRTGGNPDFFFLPSLAPDPRLLPNFDPNGFNPNLAPIIRVCLHPKTAPADLRNFDCSPSDPLIATISGSNVRVFPGLQFYLAVWKTRDYDLDPDRVYRIQVFSGSTRLGFADVTIVNSLREARNAITGDIVPFGEDWTLPIPFRIEYGALTGGGCEANGDCTEASVTPAGGRFLTNTGFAGAEFEQNWATQAAFDAGGGSIQLTITRDSENDGNCHAIEGMPRRVFDEQSGCYIYHLDPDIREFGGFQGERNKVGQCSGEARTPENASEDNQLVKSDGATIVALEDTDFLIDCSRFAFFESLPANPLLRFAALKWDAVKRGVNQAVGMKVAYAWDGGLGGLLGTGDGFSRISRGKPLKKIKVEGDNQEALVGAKVPVNPKVRILSLHVHNDGVDGEPELHGVANVPVRFTAQGGGNLGGGGVTTTVLTDEEGYASTPWFLGSGTNVLDVESQTLDATVLTFTATGRLASGTLTFVQQPNDQIANLRTLLVVVRAQDEAGAVLPAVLVTLKDGPRNSALGCGMGGAELTALTDETGRATFSLIDVSSACDNATLVAIGSKAGFAPMSVESQSFAIADIGGLGTATIDGAFDASWAGARCLQFSASVPEGGTIPAMLCAMNDENNVYFLVRFSRGPDPKSSVDFQFDQNRSGGINSGDDLIVFRNPTFTFQDDHWFDFSVSPSCPLGSICSRSDASAGGALNGQGAFGNNGGETVYEVSHPLQSGDNHDISVAPGQTVDFFLGLNIFAGETSNFFARTSFRAGLLKLLVR